MDEIFKLVGKCDGSGNAPTSSACACVIFDEDGVIIKEKSKAWGQSTNNIAEYVGAILALETALLMEADEFLLMSDSQLIVNQIQGNWKCKDKELEKLRDIARDIGGEFSNVEIKWIPREENTRADYLASKARRDFLKQLTP